VKEGSDVVWLQLSACDRALARIVKGDKADDKYHGSLANHDGWKAIQGLRNACHLETFAASEQGASKESMTDIFGERPAKGDAAASADVPDSTTKWPAAAKARCKDISITVRLDDVDVRMMRPRSMHENLRVPCEAASLKAVIDFLRARVHDGCFVRTVYERTGKYAKKRGADEAMDEPAADSDDPDA
jgi:hypothetical protein